MTAFIAFFVHRPVATILLTLGIFLTGLLAVRQLPVAPLPTVDFPTIVVTATMPGADPETMAATVAMPLERTLGVISGVTEITSSSSTGSTRITIQFELSRNIDSAAREVQGAINAARASLPSGMPSPPTYRKVNPADAPIMILQMTSDRVGREKMYDIASTIIQQRIAQVDGVGQVEVSGSSLPAVRVQLNAPQLDKLGISAEQVRTAIADNNVLRPKGAIGAGDLRWQIGANDQARLAADYADLVVAFRNGAPVRLRDVATVLDSVEDVRNVGYASGKPAVLLMVRKQPGANIIETVERVRALIPSLQASLPASIDLGVAMDQTATIRASIHEAEQTLVIAVILVILVVFVFLRNWRSTIIPAVVVPVSLVGTFSIMYLAGYSLDNLSLMALTIATGFVVDDAVVVLENVIRHYEKGQSPVAAAIDGTREVAVTVITISLSLVAVFIPILAMGGIIGRVLREFSVTLVAAIGISLVVSLTTTPMLCAWLLKRERGEAGPPAGPGTDRRSARAEPPRGTAPAPGERPPERERLFDRLRRGYRRSLGWALRHPVFMLLLLGATIAFNVWLYVAIPKGFLPRQDTGRLMGFVTGDESASFQATRQRMERYIALLQADPAVANVVGYVGNRMTNRGQLFVDLKPLAERGVTADQVIDRLRDRLGHEPGGRIFLVPAQDFRAGGRSANALYQYTLYSESVDDLRVWEPRLRHALGDLPELADVNTDAEDKGQQTRLVIDRDAASRLGVSQRLIGSTLNNYFGQRQVSTIYNPMNQYRVVLESDPRMQQSPVTLDSLNLVTSSGEAVPLAAVTTTESTTAPLSVNHDQLFASSTISFNLPAGVALSTASRAIEDAMAKLGMPNTIHGGFAGTAGIFQQSLASQPWLILAALLTIYIVLGILYEDLLHPLTILSTLPSAGVGALLALMGANLELTIIAMIALVLLIGIVKKNAILMIDFALDAQREQGLSPRDAIIAACDVRLRPILMTTVAAVLGAIPLAIGRGDGAELRQPLGIAIVGGLLVSQLLTLYTTPVVYLTLEGLRRRWRDWRGGPGRRPTPRPGGGGPGGSRPATDSGLAPTGQGAARMSAWLGLGVGLGLVVALAGCTVGPDYRRPTVEVPPAYRGTADAAGTASAPDWKPAGPGAVETASGPWWDSYRDPVLGDLLQRLDADYPGLAAAEARYRQARALVGTAEAALWPGVDAGVGYTRSGSGQRGGSLGSARAAIDAGWEPDLWGRMRRDIESTEATARASADDLAALRLSAEAQLATAYWQLRSADALRRLLESTVTGYRHSVQVTRNRYEAGVVPRSDVTQAETQLLTVEAQLIEVGITRAQAEHAIAVLLGRAPAGFSVPQSDTPLVVPAIPVGLPSALLERRPDIQGAEARVAAANADIGVARAAWFPVLQLQGSFGTQAATLAELFALPARVWSLGPQLAQTLFDGGARRARDARAVAAHDEAAANYRLAVLTAFQEVEDGLVAVRLLEQEQQVQLRAEAAAADALEQVTNQYQAGTVSILNLITAQATLLQARRTLVDLKHRQLLASVQLIKAIGGSWGAGVDASSITGGAPMRGGASAGGGASASGGASAGGGASASGGASAGGGVPATGTPSVTSGK